MYHFDLYRLPNEREFLIAGFEEMLGEELCCIEWPERIPTLLPKDAVRIRFAHQGKTKREIRVENLASVVAFNV